jgi:5-methyltetrahydrofolate--homocysteine methyltransferase
MPAPVYPLSLKPDLAEAAERWEAYCAGEIVDRPVICVTAPRDPNRDTQHRVTYHDLVFGDMSRTLDGVLEEGENTYYGGEAIPSFYPSFGPDAIAAFCGAELRWSEDSGDTNWSVPFVERWEEALPLRLQEDGALWQRLMALCRLAADRLAGKMLINSLDLHTNMDLLSAVRGPERLCFDVIEQPEMIDEAMKSARAIFPRLWSAVAEAAKMEERGYYHALYSMEGSAILQCDFAYLIGPEMFARWALPALEEEAEIVKHVYYHWDGMRAVVQHFDSVVGSRGLHTLQFQPGDGGGDPITHLELLERIQARGKAVHFWGSHDELKAAHRELRPELVIYTTGAGSPAEAEVLLKWFVDNT